MNTIEIISRSGLAVKIDATEYGEILARRGSAQNARSEILNTAGRVLKHRRVLASAREQTLNRDQLAQIESVARALAVQDLIDAEVHRMGYGNYLSRRDAGGLMPESFGRIVGRAREHVQHEIDHVVVDNGHRDYAMDILGYISSRDVDWSTRISGHCAWSITAPAEWGAAR